MRITAHEFIFSREEQEFGGLPPQAPFADSFDLGWQLDYWVTAAQIGYLESCLDDGAPDSSLESPLNKTNATVEQCVRLGNVVHLLYRLAELETLERL